jgi:hypothetical protein
MIESGGYPDELFTTAALPKENSDLRCMICFSTMRNSVRCPGSDCCFCKSCIEKEMAQRRVCPGCRVPMNLENYLVNRRLNNIIGDLNVVCRESSQYHSISASTALGKRKLEEKDAAASAPENIGGFDDDGGVGGGGGGVGGGGGGSSGDDRQEAVGNSEEFCDWTGPLQDLERHCLSCNFAQVACVTCKTLLRRGKLKQHEDEVHKALPCPQCKENVYGGIDRLQRHLELSCPKRMRECPNCHENLTVEAYYTHYYTTCDYNEVECPYASITGCKFRDQRRNMAAHAQDAASHVHGLLNHVLGLNSALSSMQMSRCILAVDELAREITSPLYNQLAEFDESCARQSFLHFRLNCIFELIDPVDDKENKPLEFRQRARNRISILDTDCGKLIGVILSSPENYTVPQLEIALKVVGALNFDSNMSDEFFNQVIIHNFYKI